MWEKAHKEEKRHSRKQENLQNQNYDSFILKISNRTRKYLPASKHWDWARVEVPVRSAVWRCPKDETPFAYLEETGRGPSKWGQLNPHWQACGKGKLQSPIDFPDQRVQVVRDLGELKRDYKPAHATIKNTGHDVTVTWKGDAGKIIINGTDFKLMRCHWHTPSEHTFNGTRYNLELHVVHMSSNGKIAVIGITYKYGPPDPFLAKLSRHIRSIGKEEKDIGIVNPDDIMFGSPKYYRYIGSLTTPPCTEGVIWTILEKVRTVSREQVQALRDAVDDGFEANARPTQQLGGRPIFLYDPWVKEGYK